MMNAEIRNMVKNSRIYYYEIAQALNISEFTLCRWLRNDLSDEKKTLITAAIAKISEERQNKGVN